MRYDNIREWIYWPQTGFIMQQTGPESFESVSRCCDKEDGERIVQKHNTMIYEMRRQRP